MSHEIRTPMNAILGLTHLLAREVEDPGQRDRLEKIGHAGHHLLSIINSILDLSKIEAGKLTLETTAFLTADLFAQLRTLVQERIDAKGLAFDADMDSLPPVLRGDVTRLRQALLNFLDNAVKFTDRGGIHLRGRVVEQNRGDILVRFEVEDSGIGIDRDRLGRLFQPFEQADSSTTRRFGGTGLGLAIARQLATLMGGFAH